MERRLRNLEIVWRRRAESRQPEEPFEVSRLTADQRAELDALERKIVEPTIHDRHGLNALTDFELERLTWLSAIGRGIPMDEPIPEPSQVDADRRAVAWFHDRIRRDDGTLDRDRLSDVQNARLTHLEARLAEASLYRERGM